MADSEVSGRLAGQVAVVTGAGSALGCALVEALAGEGSHVVGVDLPGSGLEALSKMPNVFAAELDVTDVNGIEATINDSAARWGRLDVLCNSATTADTLHAAEDCTVTEWQQSLAWHLHAPFAASRRALAHMLPAGHGTIINTVATAGIVGAAGGAAYTASQHALIGLTRSIAAMYATDGIHAIAISPGPLAAGIEADGQDPDAENRDTHLIRRAKARTHQAFTRSVSPRELAELVIYLTTEGANLLNGAILPANSGYSAH